MTRPQWAVAVVCLLLALWAVLAPAATLGDMLRAVAQ